MLALRTYEVLPLNEECGLVEWVDNLVSLRSAYNTVFKAQGCTTTFQDIMRAKEKKTGSDVSETMPLHTKHLTLSHEKNPEQERERDKWKIGTDRAVFVFRGFQQDQTPLSLCFWVGVSFFDVFCLRPPPSFFHALGTIFFFSSVPIIGQCNTTKTCVSCFVLRSSVCSFDFHLCPLSFV